MEELAEANENWKHATEAEKQMLCAALRRFHEHAQGELTEWYRREVADPRKAQALVKRLLQENPPN